MVDGTPSTKQIRRLIESGAIAWIGRAICSSAAIAAVLVWMPLFAMAIEKWRIRYGPHVAGWVSAIGEFEAMSSLACFAYERPDAVFPELADSSELFYEAHRV